MYVYILGTTKGYRRTTDYRSASYFLSSFYLRTNMLLYFLSAHRNQDSLTSEAWVFLGLPSIMMCSIAVSVPQKTFNKIKNRTENVKKEVHRLAGFLGPTSPSPSWSPRRHDTQHRRLTLRAHTPVVVAEDRGTKRRDGAGPRRRQESRRGAPSHGRVGTEARGEGGARRRRRRCAAPGAVAMLETGGW